MKIKDTKYDIALSQEPLNSLSITLKTTHYKKLIDLSSGEYQTTNYGIYINGSKELLVASDNPSSVHEHSAIVIGQYLYLAIGNIICKINIETKEKEWSIEVDTATCFGIHYKEDINALISHGELEISRLTTEGVILWQASGRDIFSEGINLENDFIEATDFDKNKYYFDYETGKEIKR